jgi:asparagine synthase (glutamine-hydrolysing)
MPGIMGMIHKGPVDHGARADLETMVVSAQHEPFEVSGTYQDEALRLSVGWVCPKGSFSEDLPVWNEKKDVGLFFCGEDFSVGAEVPALKARGHDFDPGDISPLVHLYEDRGDGFFKALNGCFSGLLVDRRANKIIVFNDRFGLGRVYYYENDRAFYFASEAKSLLRILPELRDLDADGLAELFAYGCLLDGKTLFTNVRLLPGGSKWAFSPGSPTEHGTYFRAEEWAGRPRLDEKAYSERFLQVFPEVLRRYFRSPQTIGISLTGGLDTRMIMAWHPGPPFTSPCYTFSGVYRDCADVTIARKVAAACQQRHETIRIGKDFFTDFPGLAMRSVLYSDGTMDVSGAAELYVNRIARGIAPVRLTGNYGDQVIRGVVGFKPLRLRPDIFEAGFAARVNAAGRAPFPQDPDPLSFFCAKQVPWYHYPRHALEMSQLTVRSPFLDNDLVSLAFQAPARGRELGTSLRFIRAGNPALARMATDRGFADPSTPFLGAARRGIRTFSKLAEYAYDYGMPRWLTRLDKALSFLHLENLFLGRHKYYHFRIWYRRELKDYVQGIILDPRTLQRPYFGNRRLERMVHDHVNGRDNYTQEIHWVLTSELIQRHFIEEA